MDEIIQIKCPFDGAVLSVRNQPGIESKSVTCPVCKHKYPFTQFKRVHPNAIKEESATEYPGGDYSLNGDEGDTTYGDERNDNRSQINFTLGKLAVVDSVISFQLKPGRNIIGRKGQKSGADFQIDTGERRSMSREHIVIEVRKVPGKGFVHYVSLFKEKVNPTFIGSEPLFPGDCLILNHGDIIKLPDATLSFEIPDDEGTEI